MPKSVSDQGAGAFGRRLVGLLEQSGHPRRGAGAYLANRYRVSTVTANDWLNGRFRPNTTTARRIATDHGESFDWLYFGSAQPDATAGDWQDILGYAQAVGLGKGVEASEYAETHRLRFRASSLRKQGLSADNLAVLYGDGDSMLPRIRSDDAIMFDTSDVKPRDGRVYVIVRDGEITVKRCEIIDGMVFFRADNAAGDHAWTKPRRMDDPAHPIKVEGRVVWIAGWET